MTSWERTRELVGSCIPFVPRGRKMVFGKFQFDGQLAHFSYRTLQEDGLRTAKRITADFLPGREPTRESFRALQVADEKRTRFIMRNRVYDEPALFGRTFPAFTYQWTKDKKSGRGVLSFFRIDFSDADFINFSGRTLRTQMKEGNTKFFEGLPESLEHSPLILGHPIRRAIDFEDYAKMILLDSELEAFSRSCHATYS